MMSMRNPSALATMDVGLTDGVQDYSSFYRHSLQNLSPNIAAELLRYGRSRPDTITLAQGEGELTTPAFIRDAATEAMASGRTFYAPVLGHPELRQEIANYYQRIFGLTLPTNRIFVTGSGTTAVALALESIINEGDEVVAVTPIWKNLIGIMESAEAKFVEVQMSEKDGKWDLDLDRLFAAVTPRTRAMLIVTPSNPTGWVMKHEEMKRVLEFARARGIWIISDEIYSRSMYDVTRAPSFLDIADPEDRLYIVNSFSKNWAMTGWRLGWLVGPADAEAKIMDLALYQNMGPTSFVQFGGIAALRHGEPFIKEQIAHWQSNLEIVNDRLRRMDRISYCPPEGTFYVFFKVDGITDSNVFARQLIDSVGLSLAPGSSFGSGCQQHMRLCFGPSAERMHQAFDRLEKGLRIL